MEFSFFVPTLSSIRIPNVFLRHIWFPLRHVPTSLSLTRISWFTTSSICTLNFATQLVDGDTTTFENLIHFSSRVLLFIKSSEVNPCVLTLGDQQPLALDSLVRREHLRKKQKTSFCNSSISFYPSYINELVQKLVKV